MSKNNATNTPQAVQLCHEILQWLIPLLDHFPRSRRYTLGERIENGLLDILEWLVAASYTRDRAVLLQRANQRLARVRHLWRLAFELQVIASKRYHHGAELIDTLGRQIGGWQNAEPRR